ncbi:MAG: biopolymer transporter ExbD [Oligoflexia bacterium]|nr:biopolymer transporter ExbD [Oligoflexia bacterium]
MNKHRFIRNRIRSKHSEDMELNLTSLLDVLVILLFFLIKNYDSSAQVVIVAKDIQLPKSISKDTNNKGVVIQVSPTTVWVDDRIIMDLRGATAGTTATETAPAAAAAAATTTPAGNKNNATPVSNLNWYDSKSQRIIPLFDELVKKREQIKLAQTMANNKPEFSATVSLVVDKTLKYSYLKKVLYTCAEAGYKQYKFVVLDRNPS